jgi:hypothetical protein
MNTDENKKRLIQLAIEELEREWANKPKYKPEPRKRLSPEDQAHYDYCEDMAAIGEETGTPWGGARGKIKDIW